MLSASAKVKKQKQNDRQSFLLCQPKQCWTRERKGEKSKYFESYTDLIKSLAKMGNWKKKSARISKSTSTNNSIIIEVSTLHCWEYNKKNRINILVNFVIYGGSWCFEVLKLHSPSASAILYILNYHCRWSSSRENARVLNFTYRKSYERECILWFMGASNVLKVPKVAQAEGEFNFRTVKYHERP